MFRATNNDLHNSENDDSMHGTTMITMLVIRDTLIVASVGDSKVMIVVKRVKDRNRIIDP